MSVSGFARGFENLSEDQGSLVAIAQNWQVFAILLTIVAGFFLFRFGRRSLVANAQPRDSGLGARLAEIDLENYDFDGTKQAISAPSVNFDDFFSNAERREELDREKPVFEPEPLIFEVPSIQDLPPPGAGEPKVSDAAKDRIAALAIAADDKKRADPSYVLSEEEALATAAFDATHSCGKIGYYVTEAPDVDRFRAYVNIARLVGAADLEAIINLQIKLMEITSTPEWRNRHAQDERWHSVHRTSEALNALFKTANKSNGGQGRLTSLVDAYLAGTR